MAKTILILILNLLWGIFLFGQDPFFTHFHGAESLYNPAMAGVKGSRSITTKYKSQWGTSTIAPFKTGLITYEESMPCLPFDYGLGFLFDQEGDGRLSTYDLSLKLAGGPSIAPKYGKSLTNFRFGLNFQFGSKQIDYSRLVFSDQLNPKYGTVDANGIANPTSFVPPNDGKSLVYFAPAVGFMVQHITNTRSTKASSFQFGGALLNAYSLGRPRDGNYDSVLRLNVNLPERYNAFVRFDFVPVSYKNRYYFSISPSFFYQKQDQLSYWESGVRIGFSRLVNAGLYYHSSFSQPSGANTKWMTFNLEMGEVLNDYNGRVDIGTSFSWNKSGLKNFASPTFELTLTYHWARSAICRNFGEGYSYPDNKQNKKDCPYWSFSNSRKRIYENIWYKTLNIK